MGNINAVLFGGLLTLTLAGEGETTVFTVTNTKDSANGITVNVE